ncbi:MAG: Asp-tRNA(Asn)/Glu-tRNA(Gln) amidotransferase subunit GatC [Luteolibacter sp.]
MLRGMSKSQIDVRYVANLARLELGDDEVALFQPQLESILGYIESISGLAIDGIEPAAHPYAMDGRMRDDDPHESLAPQEILRNAPDQAQGQIRVPKVVGDA